MSSELKQRYLHNNSPQPSDFDEQRTRQFEKLLILISTSQRKKWLSTGFNCAVLIEAYKQVYGFTSQQFQTLLMLLINICFKEEGLSTDVRAYLLKLLNTLTEYQIKITDNFRISNAKLLKFLQTLAKQGLDGTLKNSDAVIEELSKFILYFSRFGEEVVEEALQMAIDCNDIRYLVIFLRSIKSEKLALKLIAELFSDNNLWDRDCSWFYILGQIIKKFPKLDYSSYYQTIMQEVIKAFTIIINGENEEALKKLTTSDNYLQIQPVLKSAAMALAYLMLPESQPQHIFINSCIERLFSIVLSSLDYVSPPQYLNDLLTFSKAFIRCYLLRFRGQRGLYILFNEDIIDDYHEPNNKDLRLDENAQNFFDSLWVDIIPRLVYLEDPQQCKPSKIIAQLCMYKPENFLQLSLNSILAVVNRQDPTLVSFHGAKISILFLQQYVILDKPEFLNLYIDCCSKMIGHIEKLGITENLDIIELFFRTFLYVSDEQLNQYYIQSAVDDTLDLLLNILEPLSIGLADPQNQQAQLYLDFNNIFIPFFLRLDVSQKQKFSEKFIYKLISKVPQHEQAYQMIAITLTFVDEKFADKLVKHIMKELISIQPVVNIQQENEIQWLFLFPVQGTLHVENQAILKWYTSLLQCIFQYHPKNVIKHWESIQKVINLLLVEWDEQSYLQMALDIIYNVVLCLCKPHLSWQQFVAKKNSDYKTLSLNWQEMTPQSKNLVDTIFQKYYFSIKKYLISSYTEELNKNKTDHTILGDFQTYFQETQKRDIVRIRRRNLKLVDYIVNSGLSAPEDSDDKKTIYRALSVQYTVMSALMFRVPFHAKFQNIAGFFQQEKYVNLRPDNCKYLEWMLQLLGRFNMLGDQNTVKLFNFFWRESHDEVSFTAAIQATNQKISPYYYPQLYRKKELLRSPFLIVNEAYLTHMVRIQFHLIVQPTAHLNNPRYLQSNFILGLSPYYEPSLHSYFPSYVQVHQYHRQLIAICRYHLNSTNPDGYLFKFLAEQDPASKERLSTAIRYLIISIKRLLNVFSDQCCMRDQFVRNSIFETISLYKILPKKNEKSLIYQMIYVLLVFSFDPCCLEQYPQFSLSKYWSLKLEQNPEVSQMQIAKVHETVNIQKVLAGIQQQQSNAVNQFDIMRGLKLTRSCSFQQDSDIEKQIQRAVSYLLLKIQENYNNLQKDFGIYLLMLLLYSNSLSLKDPLMSKIILMISKLSQSESTEIFDMSKTGFFHLVNRFNYNQRRLKKIENTSVKRHWQDFLRFKYIGGQNVNYQTIKCQKSEQNFYPSKFLQVTQYSNLASDPSSPTYQNQKVLLSVLEDEEGMLKFLKNCSLDPDLKQTDPGATETIVLSEEDFKSISSGAHKLMHFIWDSNPTKTPLFMGTLQRYAASPLNLYNRLYRKIFRICTDKIKQICCDITKKLRQSEEPQNIRLSFYISCELMLEEPQSPINQTFIDYLGDCTKENFDFALMGFYGIFTSNFVTAQKNYNILLKKLRSLKGAPRLRHLELTNTYMIAQGRFSRMAAIDMANLILKGIDEGGDQISEAVVSMITQCFVQAVNLKNLGDWVIEPLEELQKCEKIYKLNEYVGYNHQHFLLVVLQELMKKAKEEQVSIQSLKLRIYSQMVRKILASITIYRFNEYFYQMLKDLMIYVLQKPQTNDDDNAADLFVITQLCDSEYPEHIYEDLLKHLLPMVDRTPYVIKKKLMFLQGMVIHRSFRLNQVIVPPLLASNQKQLNLDYIITVATMYRLMKNTELTNEVENLLKITQQRKKHQTYTLLAILMSTGVREFQWKESIVRDLMKHKKDKIVKEGISGWWRGKTPQTEQENRLAALVKNFENPYSYFA